MSFTPESLRKIIRGALQPITETRHPLYTEDAEELLMMIMAHESHLGTALEQVGGGPALGLCQVEPSTMWDNYRNFLATRLPLSQQIDNITGYSGPSENNLQFNHPYNIIHARLKIYRCRGVIPSAKDPVALSIYAKQFYNTPLGKATAEKYLQDYQRLVLAA